jgi:hypothetical protein
MHKTVKTTNPHIRALNWGRLYDWKVHKEPNNDN